MDLREEAHVTLSCLLYPYWEPETTSQYTLSDHPSCSGHLVQGINSGPSHDTVAGQESLLSFCW